MGKRHFALYPYWHSFLKMDSFLAMYLKVAQTYVDSI